MNRPPPDTGKDPDEVKTLSFLSQRGKGEKNLIKLHRAALKISGDEGRWGKNVKKKNILLLNVARKCMHSINIKKTLIYIFSSLITLSELSLKLENQ